MNKDRFDFLKQIWKMRFERMVALEKDSLCFYSGILRKHKFFLEGTKAKRILSSIMKDEARHIQIAAELSRLVVKSRWAGRQ